MPAPIKEHKTLQGGYVVKADAKQGIVDAIVSVFGIVDMDGDVIENGAFTRTIAERGPAGANKIRVLNQHMWTEIVGKPLVLAEHTRDQLPPELTARYPDATGGLFTRTQFNMEKEASRDVFSDLKGGFQNEWSIGFDTLNSESDTVDEQPIRRLQELRLWEYSPVTWGANQATLTTAVKDAGNADLAKTIIDRLDGKLATREITLLEYMDKVKEVMLSFGLATEESLRLVENIEALHKIDSTPPPEADSVTGKLLELAGVVLGDQPDLELPELLHELSNRLTQDAPPQAGTPQMVEEERLELARAQLKLSRRSMGI
jgi:HK97 family phage prohead protease